MSTEPHPIGIGLDTGGTFTDIVLYDLPRALIVRKAKTPTTHADYSVCIGEAFRTIDLSAGEAAALCRVVLSTTLATNAVAENRIHPTGMILEPGDIRIPQDLHPRLVLLRSQIDFDCVEVVPVSRDEVLEKSEPMAGQVESFAVSGYASTRDPRHEEQIGQILAEAFGKPVVLGSQLTHRLNLMQRARAAALNAGLLPVILEWLEAIKSILARAAIRCPLYLVKGDGSLMEEPEALRMPVHTLFSGPAASLNGGCRLSGLAEAIVIDVGGTTTDMGRVRGGFGTLREGGVRINGRSIAVDGLDIATFGLGGDSRLRLAGGGRFRFVNSRVLPFCRAAQGYPGFSVAALETELTGQWHFGDPELLELLAPEHHAGAVATPSNERVRVASAEQSVMEALRAGPRRERAVSREMIGEFSGAETAGAIESLLRRRIVIRIGLTPTDLFCAAGKIAAFSQPDAEAVLDLYARMVDLPAAEFRAVLWEAIRTQTAGILTDFLVAFDPPLELGSRVLERLSELLRDAGGGQDGAGPTRLFLQPGCKIVLVGAGAPLLYERAPEGLRGWMDVTPDGDVANAVGAIASRFLLRDTVTLEPLRYGGVELFDHHSKRAFPTLAEGIAHARQGLEARLRQRAADLGLASPELTFREEVIEDYADYSKRTRKELVIARVEATLTGLPG